MIRKEWLLTGSLCLAPLYDMNVKEDSSLFFLINEEAVKEQYREESTLSFMIDEKYKEHVQVIRYEEGKEECIQEIQWQYKEDEWKASILIQDGEKIQYVVTAEDQVWKSDVFTQDSKACELKFQVDENTVEELKDGYQQPIAVSISCVDEHYEKATAVVRQGNEELPIIWKDPQTMSFVLSEGAYELDVKAYDTFGHVTEYHKTIVIDHQKPEVEMMFNQKPLQTTPYATTVVMDLFVKEEHLDKSKTWLTIDQQEVAITWEKYKNGHKATVNLTEHGAHEILIHVEDIAGNVFEQHKKLNIDQSLPVIKWNINGEWQDTLPTTFSNPFYFYATLQDEHPTYEQSWISINDQRHFLQDMKQVWLQDGAYHITYHLEDEAGNVKEETMPIIIIDSKPPTLHMTTSTDDTFLNKQQLVNIYVEDEHLLQHQVLYYRNEQPVKLDLSWVPDKDGYLAEVSFKEEGSYELIATVDDVVGHHQEKRIQFIIDRTKPKVETKLSDNRGMVSSQDRTWIANIQDDHLHMEQSQVQVYQNQNLIQGDFYKPISESQGVWSVSVQEEGQYRIVYQITDKAGNQSIGEETFIIDKSKPKIELDAPDKFAKQGIRIPYAIEDPQLESYQLVVRHNGKEVKYLGNRAISDVLYVEDQGAYEVYISARDQAGNIQELTKSFYIDQVAPEIHVFLNQWELHTKPFLNNQDVWLTYEVSDTYLKEVSAQLWVDQILWKDWKTASIKEQITIANQEEHTYELRVVGMDEAGNQQMKSVVFTLDRLLKEPTFLHDVFQGTPYAGTWIPELTGEGSEFEVIDYTLWKDGKQVPYVWKQSISEEGRYQLSYVIRDQAMNVMRLSQPFTFIIDHSAPLIQLYDVDNAWFLNDKAPKDATLCLYLQQVDASKRLGEQFVDVLINGESMLHLVQRDEMGQAFLMIHLIEPIELEAYATDEAGNVSVLKRVIQPVEEQEVREEIQENKRSHPSVEAVMLPSTERKSKFVVMMMGVLLFMISAGVYGIKKISAHRRK